MKKNILPKFSLIRTHISPEWENGLHSVLLPFYAFLLLAHKKQTSRFGGPFLPFRPVCKFHVCGFNLKPQILDFQSCFYFITANPPVHPNCLRAAMEI